MQYLHDCVTVFSGYLEMKRKGLGLSRVIDMEKDGCKACSPNTSSRILRLGTHKVPRSSVPGIPERKAGGLPGQAESLTSHALNKG